MNPACKVSEWTPQSTLSLDICVFWLVAIYLCWTHRCYSSSTCTRVHVCLSPKGGWGGLACLGFHGQWKAVTLSSLLQAEDSRDSLAMALYARCFEWVIKKINSRIKGKDDFKSIGILDIFGFENFEVGFWWPGCVKFFLSACRLKSLQVNVDNFLCKFFFFFWPFFAFISNSKGTEDTCWMVPPLG